MKIKENEIYILAKKALKETIEKIPFVSLKTIEQEWIINNFQTDFFLTLEYSGKQKKIAIEVKSNGEPRFARTAVNQLIRYISKYPEIYGVFVAPYISPEAAEICTKEGIGFLDLSGNCRLVFNNVFIESKGNQNKYLQKRYINSLFSNKATRILRVLLSNPSKKWKTQKLATEAEVSLGQVANIKKLLLDAELISEKDKGFKLSQPETLLLKWSEKYSYRKNNITECFTMDDLDRFEEKLALYCSKKNISYAISGFTAADRIAPSVRQARSMVYVSQYSDEIKDTLQIKEVSSGSNVLLLEPYDNGVFYDSKLIQGKRVASPVQLFLDLKSYKGRGEEAAKVILERILQPSW